MTSTVSPTPRPRPGPTLRARALAGEPLLGALLRMPAEELVEMAAVSGFDFLLIDGEHGPADLVPLRQHIAAARMYGVEVLVRIGHGESALALRALDQGASGIVAPHIDTAAEAVELVDAAHYPPLGRRGFATYQRGGRFGRTTPAEHLTAAAERTLVIGMVESPVGVDAAEEIAAVDGIDGIMIGLADLAVALGPGDPSLPDSCARVHRALADAGKVRMDIVGTGEAAQAAFAAGATMVVYNLTQTLMDQFAALLSARPTPTA